MVVSNKVYFGKKGFKYFTGHKDGKKVGNLSILLPKMSTYRRGMDET